MRFIMPAFALLLSTFLVTACGNTDSVPQTAEESESADDPASDLTELTTSFAETTAALTGSATAPAVTEEATTLQATVTAAQTAAPQTEQPVTEAPQTNPPEQPAEQEVPVQQEQQPQQDNGWRDAFAAVLRNNASNYHSFSLCSIDDNDIPELVLHVPQVGEFSAHADSDVPVYVYSNGQAFNVGSYSNGGYSNFGYYPRTGLILSGFSSTGYTIEEYFRLSGTTVTSEHRFEDDFAGMSTTATIDGVESGLSMEAFEARKREWYPGQTVNDAGSYNNTEDNIQRYIYG